MVDPFQVLGRSAGFLRGLNLVGAAFFVQHLCDTDLRRFRSVQNAGDRSAGVGVQKLGMSAVANVLGGASAVIVEDFGFAGEVAGRLVQALVLMSDCHGLEIRGMSGVSGMTFRRAVGAERGNFLRCPLSAQIPDYIRNFIP